MKSMCALSVCVLVLLATVGCATHSMHHAPFGGGLHGGVMHGGIVPNSFSNTRCGFIASDMLVPGAGQGMLVRLHEPIPNYRNRPFLRHGAPMYSYGGAMMGYYDTNAYTTRAPRCFFLSNPMPLGY